MNKHEVQEVYDSFPPAMQAHCQQVRKSIFSVAERHNEIGSVDETLKWGEPSYLTVAPKTGTTIRLAPSRCGDNYLALSVHCQTSLVAQFKEIYKDLPSKKVSYDKSRSLLFPIDQKLPMAEVEHFIYMALTYHL